MKTINRDDFDKMVLACIDDVTEDMEKPEYRMNVLLISMLVLIPLKQKLFGEYEDEKINFTA